MDVPIFSGPTDNAETLKNADDDLLGKKNQAKQFGNAERPNSIQKVDKLSRNETSEEFSENKTVVVGQSDKDTKRLRFMERKIGRRMEHSGENCNKTLPQVIIIGVMKCGTEAFTTFLSLHPDIAMQLNLAAVEFFGQKNYHRGLDWYRNQMPCSKKGQITVEKSPQYFVHKFIPERVHTMNSSIKLMLIVREPVSRCVSHFSHVQSVKPGSLGSFEQTVFAKNGEINEENDVVLSSMYDKHIQKWLKYFTLDQIHIVDGDNFRNNPVEELRRTEKFLGLRPFFNEDHFVHNAKKGFYCIKSTKEHGCLSQGKGRKHSEIDETTLDKLRTFFDPLNEMFFKTIKRKFNW